MKIMGFVFGLVSLVLSWIGAIPPVWWLGLVMIALAVLGIIFSALAMSRAKKEGGSAGLAVAGLVLSIIGLVEAIICTLVGVLAFAAWSLVTQGGTQLTNEITDQLQKDLNRMLENLPKN